MGAEDDAYPDRPLPLPRAHQRVVETGLTLELLGRSVAARYGRTEGDDHGRVVARGEGLRDYVMAAALTWRALLSTRTAGPLESQELVRALENNRRVVDGGTLMQSVFADHGFDDDVPDLLGTQDFPYEMAFVTVQMKIVDHYQVMLEGPLVDGERSVMLVEHPAVLRAATEYWRAVRATARPAEVVAASSPGLAAFTPRQRAVVALLSRDVADERAAELLGISVRTLRSEVAAVKDRLGVGTRFAAGVALGRLRADGA